LCALHSPPRRLPTVHLCSPPGKRTENTTIITFHATPHPARVRKMHTAYLYGNANAHDLVFPSDRKTKAGDAIILFLTSSFFSDSCFDYCLYEFVLVSNILLIALSDFARICGLTKKLRKKLHKFLSRYAVCCFDCSTATM
jgi:hypothetical protein